MQKVRNVILIIYDAGADNKHTFHPAGTLWAFLRRLRDYFERSSSGSLLSEHQGETDIHSLCFCWSWILMCICYLCAPMLLCACVLSALWAGCRSLVWQKLTASDRQMFLLRYRSQHRTWLWEQSRLLWLCSLYSPNLGNTLCAVQSRPSWLESRRDKWLMHLWQFLFLYLPQWLFEVGGKRNPSRLTNLFALFLLWVSKPVEIRA